MGLGGLENGVVNLLNRLDPDCFSHTICCLTRAGTFAERIRGNGVEIVELDCPSHKFRFPLLPLTKLFRRLAPDIVHTRGWGAVDGVFAARLAGVPLVIHAEHGREFDDKDGRIWKRRQIRRLVGTIVHRYVVVCEFLETWLRESCKVKEEKIIHIPNGVDTVKFHPCGKAERIRQRQKLGLPETGLLLGTVGRLDRVKDFPTLMRSFSYIKDRASEAHLAIAGDGPLRDELARAATELGVNDSVHWLGERNDIPSVLRSFDVYVQTSVFEGMSNTILEAMATGLPVVASDAGGNSELVIDRVNGATFEVGDADTLARLLSIYLSQPYLRTLHGARSRKRAENQFALSSMVARYAALYRSFAEL